MSRCACAGGCYDASRCSASFGRQARGAFAARFLQRGLQSMGEEGVLRRFSTGSFSDVPVQTVSDLTPRKPSRGPGGWPIVSVDDWTLPGANEEIMGCQQAWVEAGAARNATCRARILVASRTSAANELARLEAVARDRARFCARRAEDAENRLRATTALVFARTEELARRVAAAEAKARAATMTIEDGTSSAGQLTCRDLTRRAAVIRAEAERAGAKSATLPGNQVANRAMLPGN